MTGRGRRMNQHPRSRLMQFGAPACLLAMLAVAPAQAGIEIESGKDTALQPVTFAVDATGGRVLAANYGGGTVTSVAVQPDGSLGAAVALQAAAANPGWAKALVLVLGNVVVIVLEAMVVSIQTTRLVLFEFFTRFMQGTGRAFRPLPAPPFTTQEN